LTATNDCGSHTIKRKILVESVPTAEFTSDTTAGCAPKTIKFIDQSTRNVKFWTWDFPGGVPNFSTAKNPVVRYDLPGTYDVKLTVNSSRFHHSLTKKIYITIDSIPIANFSTTIDVGKVDFKNSSRHAKAHLWIFGDNNTSSEANPTHNYTEGTYKVLYVAINSCGQDTAETTLVIGTKPTAAFQANIVKGCVPFKVKYQNNSVAATNYRWYFPGGNPSTSTDPNPEVTYSTAGKYDVQLYAANVFYSDSIAKTEYIEARTLPKSGFTNTISGFKSTFINNTTDATNYLWDFGNGKVSFLKDPVHDYGVEGEFTVRLIAQNECGIDTFRKRIAVYLVPKVNFTADTLVGCAPFKVQFREQSSVDVIEWDWQFENGEPATSKERNPCIVFDKIGRYAVKLTVKNSNGTNALTKPQFIQVVSTVYCPEHTKTRKFILSEDPFGFNTEERFRISKSSHPIIYPNPANSYITVISDQSFLINEIEMFDISGKKLSVHNTSESSTQINTENLKAGTYYLKIKNGTNSIIRKFVISN
jgi:PKD repeat protein